MKKAITTKNQIIETTKRLVKNNSHVTVKDICEASYVNIAAINYHFGDKSKLMKIVIEEIVDDLQKELLKYMASTDGITPEEGFDYVIELVVKLATENKGLIHYLFVASEIDGSVSYYGIVQKFLFSNEFANAVISKLKINSEDDPQILHSRFLILFSSLAMPMIMEFATNKVEYKEYSIDNQSFRDKYIRELIKILK